MTEALFHKETHSYFIGDDCLPSVSEIIKSAGLVDASHFNDYAKDRGSAVHLACQYLDEGRLDEATLDPGLTLYVQAYKKFRAEVPLKWDMIEKPLAHEGYRYAGTPDRVTLGPRRIVLDIKTGAPAAFHGPQLAAYALLCHPSILATKRYSLYLKADGHYTLKDYEDKRDLDVFLAALTIFHAK